MFSGKLGIECTVTGFLLFAGLVHAEERWTALKSGPFEVLTEGSDKAAREKLMYLEQFRETLRVITGKQEMRLVWPVRVLLFKKAPPANANFVLARDARMAALSENAPFSRDSLKELARILLYENTNRLPQPVEEGIIELVSTLDVNGTHITLGAPVPPAERSPGWALMHLVTVNPDYSGRTRVMISNLEQSGDFEAACHNAFEKSEKQIREQADAYLKAGNFGTTSVFGRSLSLTRDFKPVSLEPEDARIAQADLLLAAGSPQAAAAYNAVHGAPSAEGQGILAAKAHKNNEALMLLRSAIEGKSESARAWLELGVLESDAAKADQDLKKAAALNPRWAEPYFRMAERAEDPAQKSELLKKAANLEARNIDYWQALARAETAGKNYVEAQKAWGGAERAAATDQERARIHQVRLQAEQERYDFEIAERKRIAAEKEAELQRLKAQSEAAIHQAEAEARKKLNPDGAPVPKTDVWWEDAQANTTAEGVFTRLDCLGKQARIVLQTVDGKAVQLLVRDPSQIVISGGGEKSLACGPQRPARKVSVQYIARPDAKLKTSGDAQTLEFR